MICFIWIHVPLLRYIFLIYHIRGDCICLSVCTCVCTCVWMRSKQHVIIDIETMPVSVCKHWKHITTNFGKHSVCIYIDSVVLHIAPGCMECNG